MKKPQKAWRDADKKLRDAIKQELPADKILLLRSIRDNIPQQPTELGPISDEIRNFRK
jgi:hypothetical protein